MNNEHFFTPGKYEYGVTSSHRIGTKGTTVWYGWSTRKEAEREYNELLKNTSVFYIELLHEFDVIQSKRIRSRSPEVVRQREEAMRKRQLEERREAFLQSIDDHAKRESEKSRNTPLDTSDSDEAYENSRDAFNLFHSVIHTSHDYN